MLTVNEMHDFVIGVGNSFNTDVSHFSPESFSRCAHFQGDFTGWGTIPCEEVHSGRYLSIHIPDDGLLGGTDTYLDTLSLCKVQVFGAPGISIYIDPLSAKHGYDHFYYVVLASYITVIGMKMGVQTSRYNCLASS